MKFNEAIVVLEEQFNKFSKKSFGICNMNIIRIMDEKGTWMFDFENREEIKNFISNNESSIYTGKNVDKEKIIIVLEQGKGMDIKTQKRSKPKWYEVIEYDKDGFQVGLTYESVVD